MATDNPFDEVLEQVVGGMVDISADLKKRYKGVKPFNSQQLSHEEQELMHDHPLSRYPDEPNLTNAMAAARWYEEDPENYIQTVDEVYARRQKAGKEVTNG